MSLPEVVIVAGVEEPVIVVSGAVDSVIVSAAESDSVVPSAPGPRGNQGIPGSDADATALLEAHIVAPEPHPAYDDIPTLRYIFENGLI